ncbi:MAG: 2-Chloromaleylacetate/maleylacetate reductase PcpE [Pseudomonadota bacterium]
MGHGVDAAGDAEGHGQAEGELGVVDDGAWQHAGVAAGFFQAGLGDAVDGGHLAAGVGGGYGHDGQARIERDRLAQAGGGPTADGHGAVGAQFVGDAAGFAGGLDGHVHDGAVKNASGARPQHVGHALGAGALFGRGQDQGAFCAQGDDFTFQVLQAARTKHHALWLAEVNEVFHEGVFCPQARAMTRMTAA